MSLSQFYDLPNSPNIQKIWNNETFDGSDGSGKSSSGWSILRPISNNRLNSLDPQSCKENRGTSLMPKRSPAKKVKKAEELDLDEEMEMLEREIARLNCRLEELKLKKASLVQKPGRIVPSKFKVEKAFSTPNRGSILPNCTPVSDKSSRRGVSLGPLEIQNGYQSSKRNVLKELKEINEEEIKKGRKEEKLPNPNLNNDKLRRRGASLGPLEIQKSSRSARKQNFNKLEEIKEENGLKEVKTPIISSKPKSFVPKRGVSLGPLEISSIAKMASKNQSPMAKINGKSLKSEKMVASSTSKASLRKSKSIFNESFKNGEANSRRLSIGRGKSRVVPSRYSLAPVKGNIRDEPECKRRKWSLPGEEGEEDSDTKLTNGRSPQSITKIATLLPKIKAVRINAESPRDSGRAKRVSDLAGKKPFFSTEGVSSYQDRAFG